MNRIVLHIEQGGQTTEFDLSPTQASETIWSEVMRASMNFLHQRLTEGNSKELFITVTRIKVEE